MREPYGDKERVDTWQSVETSSRSGHQTMIVDTTIKDVRLSKADKRVLTEGVHFFAVCW